MMNNLIQTPQIFSIDLIDARFLDAKLEVQIRFDD